MRNFRVLALVSVLLGAAYLVSLHGASRQRVVQAATDFQAGLVNSQRESATFVTLARNSDLEDLLPSIQSVEDRFNRKFHYDWVFINNEEFSDEFIERVTALVSGTAKFGLTPEQHWSYPSWIDQDKAAKCRQQYHEAGVPYGSNDQYRHMCRYESGFFFQHELMLDYRYYWRVEPETKLHCNIDYDVFEYMRENNKQYGWTISITEFENTIPTLWNTTLDFVRQHPSHLHPNRLEQFVTDDGMGTYNLCHFWSNFEVADMSFWRGQVYQDYFDHLDRAGGFFYERWGDAPVHSIAAALFMDRDALHFFDDIAYSHPPFLRCPTNQSEKGLACSCMTRLSFDWHESSCLRNYLGAKNVSFVEPER